MKKSKLTRVIVSLLLVASVLALKPIGVSASWKKDSTGWWYTEGNSWATGWKNIDRKWYYFYSDGYAAKGWQRIDGNWYYFDKNDYFSGGAMEHDTIVDGYYLNSNGSWSNGDSEIKMYAELLNNTNWQRSNGIMFYDYKSTLNKNMVGKSTIDKNIIIDIDQDGLYEMLLHDGTNDANSRISVVVNNGGDFEMEHLNIGIGGYRGYSKSQKVFFIGYTHMGRNDTIGYKLENGRCKEVYSSSSYEYNGNSTYTVDKQNVSKEEYYESFKQFGDIVIGGNGDITIL